MSEETLVVVCPNPKCQREIEEPIILTILSMTPSKKYEACPYCFSKLESEHPIEQKDVPEAPVEREVTEEEAESNRSVNSVLEKVKISGPRFLQKVKVLIPGSDNSKKEKRKKTEEAKVEPTAKKEKSPRDEHKIEPVAKEEAPKEKHKIVPANKKESEKTGCPESFGYLANRPPDTPIPTQCLVCPKMVDCMLSPRISKRS